MLDEKLVHDRVNLARLVRRLEKTVAAESWTNDATGPSSSTPVWIRTRGTLQKVKHARKLLQNVEANEDVPSPLAQNEVVRKTLDRLESIVTEVDKRVAPAVSRPAPILPTIPPPAISSRELGVGAVAAPWDATALPLPAEETSAIAAHELLLTPSDSRALTRGPINPSEALLPSLLPAAAEKSTTQAKPAFMQNSAALQEELSVQLAQMATQLKRNAVHFSASLAADKAVVEDAQEKLERNYDVMSKERVRLRDHQSNSWGTTWITILSLLVVLVGFFITFLVIRIT